MNAPSLCSILSEGRFNLSDEKQTQTDIATHLRSYIPAIDFTREHRLNPTDRPDFFVRPGGVVIEVKLRARKRAIFDQLARYATHDEVRELILMTNTAMGLPPEIGGKPAYYLSLGRAWL